MVQSAFNGEVISNYQSHTAQYLEHSISFHRYYRVQAYWLNQQ